MLLQVAVSHLLHLLLDSQMLCRLHRVWKPQMNLPILFFSKQRLAHNWQAATDSERSRHKLCQQKCFHQRRYSLQVGCAAMWFVFWAEESPCTSQYLIVKYTQCLLQLYNPNCKRCLNVCRSSLYMPVLTLRMMSNDATEKQMNGGISQAQFSPKQCYVNSHDACVAQDALHADVRTDLPTSNNALAETLRSMMKERSNRHMHELQLPTTDCSLWTCLAGRDDFRSSIFYQRVSANRTADLEKSQSQSQSLS